MLRKLLSNHVRKEWLKGARCEAYKKTVTVSPRRYTHSKLIPENGPNLKDFIYKATAQEAYDGEVPNIPYIDSQSIRGEDRKVYFEIYGCQMNKNDADVVWSILQDAGYQRTTEMEDADVILLLTCALREGAEKRVWERLYYIGKMKKRKMRTDGMDGTTYPRIGLLGCMAERLKEKVIEKDKLVDIVAGPDSYKDLPRLLAIARNRGKAINVMLSLDETYADVMPVRLNEDSVTSYVTIMRGCDNMCTYCIVPFTRGKERSRPVGSIVDEVRILSENGVKEVTLLGQNVNSYRDLSNIDGDQESQNDTHMAKGFKTVYKVKKGGTRFAELLHKVSEVDPEMRIRFISPHPKDFPDQVLQVIKERPNICKAIHLPAQSGNSAVLERMRRGYTREAYLELVDKVRQYIPSVSLSTDVILGFCGETEQQFQDTVSLLELVKYNVCYIYAYSMREKTTAHRRYEDDVPNEVKLKRVEIISKLFRSVADELHKAEIGKRHLMLVEKTSKRSDQHFVGRNDANIKVIVPVGDIPENDVSAQTRPIKPGDYVCVQVHDANSETLRATPLFHTTMQQFYSSSQYLPADLSLKEKTHVNV